MSDTVSLKILVDTVKGVAGVKKMGDSLINVSKTTGKTDKAFLKLTNELKKADKELTTAARKTGVTAKELRVLEKKSKEAANKLKFLASGSQKASKQLSKIDKEAGKTSKSMGGLGKAFRALAGVVATVAVFDKLRESISLASDMTEIQTKFDVVFGNISKGANKWAQEYSETMGFSVMKTKESMGDIQNLFTGFGMGRKQSFGLSKDIIGLANDLDSFNNLSSRGVDVQKTMISALMGETEAAKTLGASILETNLQIASSALGFGKYSSKMAESTKIQIRLKAIQMQSTDAIGDVARNLKTEVGLRRQLNSGLTDLKVSLGNKLMPIQIKALNLGIRIIEMIKENKEALNRYYNSTVNVIKSTIDFTKGLKELYESSKLVRGTINTIIGAYISHKAILLALWGVQKAKAAWELATLIPTGIQVYALDMKALILKGKDKAVTLGLIAVKKTMLTVTKLQTIAQGALNLAMKINPIGRVISLIALAVGAGYLLYKNWDTLKKKTADLWKALDNNPLGRTIKFFLKWLTPIGQLVQGFKALYRLYQKFSGKKKLEVEIKENRKVTYGNNGRNQTSYDFPIDGSHRTGISYIPKDGYMAELHKGERVLTSNENKKYNSKSESKSNVVTITIEKLFDSLTIQKAEDKDLDEITDKIAEKFVSKLNLAIANLG